MNLDLNLATIIIQIIFLEGILSIDNAAVLGAMVSVLPAKDTVPWPGFLKFLGPPIHRLLGGQRSAALKVGLLGAYLGRGLMLVMANVNELLDWALVPVILLIKTSFRAIALVIHPAIVLFKHRSSFVSQSGELTFIRHKKKETKSEI